MIIKNKEIIADGMGQDYSVNGRNDNYGHIQSNPGNTQQNTLKVERKISVQI